MIKRNAEPSTHVIELRSQISNTAYTRATCSPRKSAVRNDLLGIGDNNYE